MAHRHLGDHQRHHLREHGIGHRGIGDRHLIGIRQPAQQMDPDAEMLFLLPGPRPVERGLVILRPPERRSQIRPQDLDTMQGP